MIDGVIKDWSVFLCPYEDLEQRRVILRLGIDQNGEKVTVQLWFNEEDIDWWDAIHKQVKRTLEGKKVSAGEWGKIKEKEKGYLR